MSSEQVKKDRSLKSVQGTGPAKSGQAATYKDESKDKASIKPGLMVHAKGAGQMGGAVGQHVGTVDHLDGDNYIKLTKKDSSDQQHRWIPTSWVARADNKAIYLNKTEEEFHAKACKSCPEEIQNEETQKDEMLNKAV